MCAELEARAAVHRQRVAKGPSVQFCEQPAELHPDPQLRACSLGECGSQLHIDYRNTFNSKVANLFVVSVPRSCTLEYSEKGARQRKAAASPAS